MGQYFKLVNPDRKEFVDVPGMMKDAERASDPKAGCIHVYLTLQGPDDGTYLPTSGGYVGRWAGDGVMWVGDYDESGIYDDTRPTTVIEVESGRMIEYEQGLKPKLDPKLNRTSNMAGVGDKVEVSYHADGEYKREVGTVTKILESEWTDITDSVLTSIERSGIGNWFTNQ